MNRRAKTLLVLALVAVVGMAFRVSWNALKDVASAVGADATAALLYPFVVDGLMALALVATLVLTGKDRVFALRVLAGYTLASLVLNYVHGLAPSLYGSAGRVPLADWGPANWALVLLATSLPVGAIFFGSDLVAKVLHHQPVRPVRERPEHDARGAEAGRTGGRTALAGARTAERTSPVNTHAVPRTPAAPKAHPPERTGAAHRAYEEAVMERKRLEARQVYAESLAAGRPIGPAALSKQFGLSEGWARKQIKAVQAERSRGPALVGAVG
ncbi:DUF2637 domain-containing protein [Streptomyces sp. JJ38]|uniref:DUF2637 domain-containing protein n=1 Tax=Streptomyces sp. JJ38 TaxID=2738128 RepID=UPI001C5812EF|nr:DUF2637 domain-containing protein [Streptomyces sp. JJ38]MBW1597924.1 DUF2637 domain-containing protein [Streptomyces sp. JJ38]